MCVCIDLVSFFNSWHDGGFYVVSDTMNASARARLGKKGALRPDYCLLIIIQRQHENVTMINMIKQYRPKTEI